MFVKTVIMRKLLVPHYFLLDIEQKHVLLPSAHAFEGHSVAMSLSPNRQSCDRHVDRVCNHCL